MKNAEAIVFDHDGTLTDSRREGEQYEDIFLTKLSIATGTPRKELEPLMTDAQTAIRKNPGSYGWQVGDLIVAPATADHILRMQTAADLVLKQLHRENIQETLYQLYQQTYAMTDTIYKPEAQEIIIDLHRQGNFSILTNSDTAAVHRNLHTLLRGSSIDPNTIHVVGDAKKWSVDNSWEVVDISRQPPGFPRPVYLRRPHYAKVLESLGKPIGMVAGDIYELDLALPEQLGVYTVLVTSVNTAPWELAHYQNHLNGIAAATLGEVYKAIEQR